MTNPKHVHVLAHIEKIASGLQPGGERQAALDWALRHERPEVLRWAYDNREHLARQVGCEVVSAGGLDFRVRRLHEPAGVDRVAMASPAA